MSTKQGDEVGILGKYLVKNVSNIFWVFSMLPALRFSSEIQQ